MLISVLMLIVVGVLDVGNEMIGLLIAYRVFVRKFNLTDEKALEMSQILEG